MRPLRFVASRASLFIASSLGPRLQRPAATLARFAPARALSSAPSPFGEVNAAESYAPPARVSTRSHVSSLEQYRALHARSIGPDAPAFWAEAAREHLTWFRPFSDAAAVSGGFGSGDMRYFSDGQLNVSFNCLDRHVLAGRGEDVAVIYDADEPGAGRSFTFAQALEEVSRIANVLLAQGVRRGDSVAVYLPTTPELAFTMLACARIGAVHNVVFAGMSAESLRDRIVDSRARVVVTADEGRRAGRAVPLKATVEAAVASSGKVVEKVLVFPRAGVAKAAPADAAREVRMEVEMPKARPFCPPVAMDAEDPLFLLYTSGSTGKPKGLVHSTAGYLLYAAMTHKFVFDARKGDVMATVADLGWVTGHSYAVYAPLCNGVTTLLFESTPLYPDASRYWSVVEKHKVTQLYTAPTAIRALMKYGDAPVKKHDLSSLRILGSAGEPINPEAWRWFHSVVGQKQCAVVDTFWQTETGGHVITPLPGCTPTKAGSATLPFLGIDLVLKDKEGRDVEGNSVTGVVCIRKPWPGMARTIHGDHARFLSAYLQPFAGTFFTGDGAIRDKDGFYWITGRVDDVMNMSGHRIGSAEIESALLTHSSVAESAVIGFPHELKGEGICCYVTLKAGVPESEAMAAALKAHVRKVIGAYATPDHVVLTHDLPKTRSGKIMRRILRKLIARDFEAIGDTSTLADPGVVAELKAKVLALKS